MTSYDQLFKWYKRVTWFGIFLNSLFIFPLMLAPRFTLDLLGIDCQPMIFARACGMLLLWISVFYIPATIDLKKYRVYAWLAMFPSRIGGATFFFCAVLFFGKELGYLPIAIVDASILLMQLTILLKIRAVEHPRASTIPVKRGHSKLFWAIVGAVLVMLIVVGFTAWYKLFRVVHQNFASIEEQYKYGSIGTEEPEGVPYWIWVALPRMFPEYLPGPGGYNSLGLYNEPGHDMPVGFSKKTIGFDRVGVTCALCHSATVRLSPNEAPVFLTGGGSSTADLLSYQRFLFHCASDSRFTGKNVLAAIAPMYKLSWIDRVLHRYFLVPAVKKALLKQKELYNWTNSRPDWGPGRIDPFNPMKNIKLHVPVGDTVGNSDMVPFWNMRPREGMALHWDGLNTHLVEVVRSSSIGDGSTPKTIPLAALQKLQDWILDLKPPKYPADRFPINATLAAAGKSIYDRDCAECHAFGGAQTGKVLSLSKLGTDPNRSEEWRPDAADAYNAYAKNYPWGFSGFRATDGYVNVPLDAIWTRAPYLHNGSVPTLRDLLDAPENRPKVFYRAYNVFEPVKVGFMSDGPEALASGSRYDTSIRGNSNQGHIWGTALAAKDKDALVEYMKTL
jgi:Cytochrome C oxidase, cbb3-type, subunit III